MTLDASMDPRIDAASNAGSAVEGEKESSEGVEGGINDAFFSRDDALSGNDEPFYSNDDAWSLSDRAWSGPRPRLRPDSLALFLEQMSAKPRRGPWRVVRNAKPPRPRCVSGGSVREA